METATPRSRHDADGRVRLTSHYPAKPATTTDTGELHLPDQPLDGGGPADSRAGVTAYCFFPPALLRQHKLPTKQVSNEQKIKGVNSSR